MSNTKVMSIDATQAKNRFGDLLKQAKDNVVVSLVKRGHAAAYVVSPKFYADAMASKKASVSQLVRLERQFDDMLAGMQQPASRAAVDELLSASDAAIRAVVSKKTNRRGR